MQQIAGEDASGRLAGYSRERVTSGFPTITTDHALIHEGKAFTLAGTLAINAASASCVEVTVPAGAYVHFKPVTVTASGGPVTVSIIEAPTMTGGTTATPHNRKRIGTTANSALTCKTGGTRANGTVLDVLYLPSATQGANRTGAGAGLSEEWVLHDNRTYCIEFANAAASTTTVGYSLFWYEESGA